jgi:hypothetical protein
LSEDIQYFASDSSRAEDTRLLEAAIGIRLPNGTAGVTKSTQQVEGFLESQKYDYGVQLEAAALMIRYDMM